MSFYNLYNEMGIFSTEVFHDSDSIGHLKKLKEEADECIENPSNIEEYADCLLCLYAAAYKSGFEFNDLLIATEKKLNVLKEREWEKDKNGLYQHKKI